MKKMQNNDKQKKSISVNNNVIDFRANLQSDKQIKFEPYTTYFAKNYLTLRPIKKGCFMVIQCAIIFGCLALGELIVWLTGIKLPSSMIGMLLLTTLLSTNVIKLKHVDAMANFLVNILGFFFVPAAVSLMLLFDIIKGQWVPILSAATLGTMLEIVVTGWIHQLMRKL